ncbi:MAG: extracellular solute-binding protein [Sandaracinaceae bacterium]
MSRRALRGLAVLGLVAMVAALAPEPAAAQTLLRVWHVYRGGEERALAEVVRAFEEREPGVHVVLVPQPFGAYPSKLESAIPTGNGPDLFIDTHDRVGGYMQAGLLAAVDVASLERRMDPEHLDAFAIDGVRYGVPLSLKCAALYVNARLASGPFETLEQLAAAPRPDDVYAIAMEAESAYWTSSLFAAYGRGLLTEDGHFGLIGEPAERALTQLRGLVDAGAIPEESTGDLVSRLFSDGRAVSAISGPWLAPDLPEGLEWRVEPLPRVEGAGGRPMRPYVTVEGAYVSAFAEHPELARRFAEFAATDVGAVIRGRRGRQVPTDTEVWGDLGSDPFLVSFREAARAGVITPTHRNMRMAYVPADQAIRKVLRGTLPPHDALIEAAHRFDDLTRALPPPASGTPWLIGLGLVLAALAFTAVQRARQAEVRAAIRRSLPAYRYVAHAAVAVGLLVILPLVVGMVVSLFSGQGTDLYFVGIANYVDILTARGGELVGHGSFWLVLAVTVLWTVLNVALHVVIGVALALLLERPFLKLRGVYRVLLILPWAVPNYVTALAWKGMFHRQFGAVNAILTSLGAEPVSWFSSWTTAFAANVATNVWLGFPFMMVVTLGALTAIPKDLYEAAAVDGASAWQRFTKITMPLLVPFLAPAVAMGSVWTFNMFNVVFLVSGGEPDGSTEILVSEAYRWAFTRGNQYGYAAAYAVLIFVILAIATRGFGGAKRARAA